MSILFIDSQGGVYRSDVTTGNTTKLADYSQTWTDIAVLPGGRVFATTFSGLYELNLNAGTAVLRKSLSGSINGLAADSQGRLYLGGANDEIVVISSSTFNTLRTIDLPAGTRSDGDIHINGDRLYYSTTDATLLTINLNTGAVVNEVYHGVNDLFGMHSEGGKLYGLSGNDIYLINPQTGATTLQLELPASVTIYGAATLAGVRINGTAQDDVLQADQGGSKIYALGGSDILIGSAVADGLDGGSGRDFLHGRGGSDTLVGGTGNDLLEGGSGNDRMSGGDGRDALVGGRGNDTQTGGGGQDTFVFNSGDGADRITDFQNNIDTLEFSVALLGGRPATVASLLSFATNTAGGVLFDFGARGKLLVEDIAHKADLADDILLV